MSKRVGPTITLTERGEYWVAVHEPTGVSARGETRDEALAELDEAVTDTDESGQDLDTDVEQGGDGDSTTPTASEIWQEMTAESKRRFDEEGVTDDDVEDAIEWARSQ
jgi:hypothetical protein